MIDDYDAVVTRFDRANDWPRPEPLPDALPAVAPFDPRLLPDAFRPWIEDIAERMQCPPDFPAVGAMVAVASLIGRRIGIHPKTRDDWLEVPNLWGAVVGRPGVMKSPALAEAMKPLRRLAAEAQAAHVAAGKTWDLELAAIKGRKDALQTELKKVFSRKVVEIKAAQTGRRDEAAILAEMAELQERAEDGEPKERRYLTSDSTTEKLGELLRDNPAGLLVFRDELTGWLRTLDKESRESDRAFYLEAWNGTGAFTFDRIGRGTIHIDAACVSVLGGIQPGPLSEYVAAASREGRGADGLLQRFQLLVYPDDAGDWRNVDRYPDTAAKNSAYQVFDRLADPGALAGLAGSSTLERGGNFFDSDIPALRFDPAAQEHFDAWRSELERSKLRNGEPEIIEAHLAKYRKLIPALSLVLHVVDHGCTPVGESAVIRATAWGEYLESHARRVYSVASRPELFAARALVQHLRDLPNPFRPKNVYDKGWQHLDRDSTSKAIDLLEDLNWLRTARVDTGGRPSVICRVNPEVLK